MPQAMKWVCGSWAYLAEAVNDRNAWVVWACDSFYILIYWRQTGMPESNLSVQSLVNQKRLSYSSPAIYGDQMGLVTLVKSMQLLDFLVPSNNPCHRNYAFIFRWKGFFVPLPKNKSLFSYYCCPLKLLETIKIRTEYFAWYSALVVTFVFSQ